MAYETGTALDVPDLLTKLDTFATANGWTTGYATNPDTTDGHFALSKGSVFWSIKFPTGAQAPATTISCHQATAFSSGSAPGAQTGDSGNGYNATNTGHTNGNLDGERCVLDIGNGPYPSYHFFHENTSTHDHIYVVVEATPGMFRHFGAGKLVKFGDNWVGGEFVYGHNLNSTGSGAIFTSSTNGCFLDGLETGELFASTVRIASGLPNQGAAVWGVSVREAAATLQTDTAGNIRQQIHGGYRVGPEVRGYGSPVGNTSAGFVPMSSITAYYRDPNNRRVVLLGHMPNVRQLGIRNFTPGVEISIGAETWITFPFSIKSVAAVQYKSAYAGVAYRKVV